MLCLHFSTEIILLFSHFRFEPASGTTRSDTFDKICIDHRSMLVGLCADRIQCETRVRWNCVERKYSHRSRLWLGYAGDATLSEGFIWFTQCHESIVKSHLIKIPKWECALDARTRDHRAPSHRERSHAAHTLTHSLLLVAHYYRWHCSDSNGKRVIVFGYFCYCAFPFRQFRDKLNKI